MPAHSALDQSWEGRDRCAQTLLLLLEAALTRSLATPTFPLTGPEDWGGLCSACHLLLQTSGSAASHADTLSFLPLACSCSSPPPPRRSLKGVCRLQADAQDASWPVQVEGRQGCKPPESSRVCLLRDDPMAPSPHLPSRRLRAKRLHCTGTVQSSRVTPSLHGSRFLARRRGARAWAAGNFSGVHLSGPHVSQAQANQLWELLKDVCRAQRVLADPLTHRYHCHPVPFRFDLKISHCLQMGKGWTLKWHWGGHMQKNEVEVGPFPYAMCIKT